MTVLKKTLSLILTIVMLLGLLIPCVSAAENDEFNVVVSIEGLTLGQGIYVKPTAYTLNQINELVAQKGYGPFTEDNLTAAMATLAFFIDHGIVYENTGSWDNSFYLSSVKGIDTGTVNIPAIIGEHGGPTNESNAGNDDEYLGEFDYGSMSGWMITVNNFMITQGCSAWELKNSVAAGNGENYGNTYNVRWQFTVHGYGADLGHSTGWGNEAYFSGANKDKLYAAYAKSTDEAAKAAALTVMENLTASQSEVDAAAESLVNKKEEPSSGSQDVSAVLNEVMANLAATVTQPQFGTGAGEWTVLGLARGGYYPIDNAYFTEYYNRIVPTVNDLASKVSSKNGALHRVKSTENSRLILALSAIGKNATTVGDWNLITPFDDFNWIKKQGINGPIFALIALDSQNYQTTDPTIRQQCVDYILSQQLSDGGWALSGSISDPDITAMALQALVNYKDQPAVAADAQEAFAWLASAQKEDGGYASWGTVNSESIAQVITACTAWGIDPDTDSRFVKNGKSAVDALLSFYDAEKKMFCHVAGDGGNGMATDQGTYALVAYNRFTKGQTSLYNMSDVPLEGSSAPSTNEMTAALSLPSEIENTAGTKFNAAVSINKWDNDANYKLIDFIISVPKGLNVTSVTASQRLGGGEVSYNLEKETGKLRVVYFDSNANSSLTVSGTEFPAELFTIGFTTETAIETKPLSLAITGMSVKLTSDSSDEASMVVVNTDKATGSINVVSGISFSAVALYQGDDVDLISSSKKAVTVAVTGIASQTKIAYNDGTNQITFLYSDEISQKTGVSSYIALVDSKIDMVQFTKKENYTIDGTADALAFGDANADGSVNAQDALAAVDCWLRKGTAPTDTQILTLNVNGDSRINTFDALGIVEAFVNNTDYAVVTKAAALGTRS